MREKTTTPMEIIFKSNSTTLKVYLTFVKTQFCFVYFFLIYMLQTASFQQEREP